MGPNKNDPNWERDAIVKLAESGLREQRATRRWGIFFKVLLFAYLFILLAIVARDLAQTEASATLKEHVGVVDVNGVIASGEESSAANVVKGLRSAFKAEKSVAVMIRINSPGGSPVQAGYINDEIQRLKGEYPEKKVYAVVSDICASGGYYIAAAADEVYANKASIVGSIGVRMDSFGFVDAIDKLGIERRLLTAGEHKGLLDPFLPEDETAKVHLTEMLDDIHQQFIDVVKDGRGKRLNDNPDIFTGLVWTGERAVELGLVDALGSPSYVAREVIGQEKMVDYTPEEDLLERFAANLGQAAAKVLIQQTDGLQLH